MTVNADHSYTPLILLAAQSTHHGAAISYMVSFLLLHPGSTAPVSETLKVKRGGCIDTDKLREVTGKASAMSLSSSARIRCGCGCCLLVVPCRLPDQDRGARDRLPDDIQAVALAQGVGDVVALVLELEVEARGRAHRRVLLRQDGLEVGDRLFSCPASDMISGEVQGSMV